MRYEAVINVRLRPGTKKRIDAEAKKKDLKVGEVVRETLEKKFGK